VARRGLRLGPSAWRRAWMSRVLHNDTGCVHRGGGRCLKRRATCAWSACSETVDGGPRYSVAAVVGVGGGVSVLSLSNTTYALFFLFFFCDCRHGSAAAMWRLCCRQGTRAACWIIRRGVGRRLRLGRRIGRVRVIGKDTQAFMRTVRGDAKGGHPGAAEGVRRSLGRRHHTGFVRLTDHGVVRAGRSAETITQLSVAAGGGFCRCSGLPRT